MNMPTTDQTLSQPLPQASTMMGPKVMLMGPSGTGKTHAIGTLVDWAAEQTPPLGVFCLFTENGLESLVGYWSDKEKEVPKNLHWHVAMTKPITLAGLLDGADKVGKLSYDALTKMQDGGRSQNNAFYKILSACSNFPDDRTGQKFGSVDSWGSDKIFVVDSLSELGNAAFKMVTGNKPTASPSDYGVAQNNLLNFLRLCTQGLACTFIITAHVERQQDEITGGIKLMVKSIGKALANDLPQLFSDVIYTVREGTSWYWDTAAGNADTKTRSLPIISKIKPDFGQIMTKWVNRKGS